MHIRSPPPHSFSPPFTHNTFISKARIVGVVWQIYFAVSLSPSPSPLPSVSVFTRRRYRNLQQRVLLNFYTVPTEWYVCWLNVCSVATSFVRPTVRPSFAKCTIMYREQNGWT